LKLRQKHESSFKLLVVGPTDTATLKAFKSACARKLTAGNERENRELGDKVVSVTLLPDIELIEDADLQCLKHNDEIEIVAKW
jgi:hypothetical protein